MRHPHIRVDGWFLVCTESLSWSLWFCLVEFRKVIVNSIRLDVRREPSGWYYRLVFIDFRDLAELIDQLLKLWRQKWVGVRDVLSKHHFILANECVIRVIAWHLLHG